MPASSKRIVIAASTVLDGKGRPARSHCDRIDFQLKPAEHIVLGEQ
jgi:hypothetical protein